MDTQTTTKFFDSTKVFWAWIYLSVVVGNATLSIGLYKGYQTFFLQQSAIMIGSVEAVDQVQNYMPSKRK